MTTLISPLFFDQLSQMKPDAVCERSLCTFNSATGTYELTVWNHKYLVRPHEYMIHSNPLKNGDAKLHPYFDIFIIHYLLSVKNISASGIWISEKDIPGGSTFFRGPHEIPTHLVTEKFADAREFLQGTRALQGVAVDNMGDAAVILEITPRIPVMVIYWERDEDFPAESKILYDETIIQHFPADVVYALAFGICQGFGTLPPL
ncbi:MAG: DUF3786 domain-containing protein [Desulfamplus sp.]|nr:DUF3786 domain-containing protein [Desulfamplus sp.]